MAFDPDAYLKSTEPKTTAFDPDSYLASKPQEENQKGGLGFGELASDVGTAISQVPTALLGAAAQAYQGNSPEAIIEQDSLANKLIEDARKSAKTAAEQKGGEDKYMDFLGFKIKRSDVRNMPQNLSMSAVTMGSGILTGLTAGALATPETLGVATIPVATAATMATAGKLAYNIDTNSFLRDFRDGLNQESMAQRGIPISNEEFLKITQSPDLQAAAKQYGVALKGSGSVEDLAREHGLHEAGWEAIGSVVGIGAGKYIFKQALQGKIIKPVAAAVGELGAELAGETATQIGQTNVERKAGISEEKERSYFDPESWKKSFEEVAGPTLISTGVMAGAPHVAGAATRIAKGKATPETEVTQAAIPPEAATPPSTSQDTASMIAELEQLSAPDQFAKTVPAAPKAEAIPEEKAQQVIPPSVAEKPQPSIAPIDEPINKTTQKEEPAPTPAKVEPVKADRLQDPAVQASLKRYAAESGWSEIGGRIIREVADDYSSPIIGRTRWTPNASWWTTRPVTLKGDINGAATQKAINKALRGEKLKPNEKKMVDFLVNLHDLDMTEGDRIRAEMEEKDREVAEFNKQFEAPAQAAEPTDEDIQAEMDAKAAENYDIIEAAKARGEIDPEIQFSRDQIDYKKLAENQAKSIKTGKVEHQEGDLAVYSHYNKYGGPHYTASKGTRYSANPELANFGDPAVNQRINQIIRQKEMDAETLHRTKPFIKFTNGVAVSENVPKNIANVLRGWKSLLGIKANIYIATFDDVVANKDNYTGPHREINGTIGLEKANGVMKKLPNGDYFIVMKPGASRTYMLETLAHELGHIHEYEVYANAGQVTQQAIRDEFEKWLKINKPKTTREYLDAMRAYKASQRTRVENPNMPAYQMPPYWREFTEWYADQMARWAVSSEKPLSVVDKYFKKLADALKRFFNTIKGAGYLPNETFAQYINKSVANLEFESIAKQQQKGQMALFSKEEVSAQTDTQEFKRWFGDSKVVNEDGSPKVMYHGTVNFEGNVFKPSKKTNRSGNPDGYYFTSDPQDAAGYVHDLKYVADRLKNPEKYDKNEPIPYEQGAELIPVYLSIKNPFVKGSKVTPEMLRVYKEEVIKNNLQLGERAKEYAQDKAEIMKEYGDSGKRYAPGIFPNISFPTDAMQRVLEAGGYDGFQDGDRHWIAFKPNQIKSAIGNVGTFSPESADIRYSKEEVSEPSKARNIEGEIVSPVWNSPEATKTDNLIYKLQDKHIDTKRVQQAIIKEAGDLEDKWNVYLKEELYHGRTSAALRKFLLQDLMPVVKEMSKLGISPADMNEYLHNRHAEERNDQIAKIRPATLPDGSPNPAAMTDGGSGLTYKQIKDYFDKLDPAKAKKFEEVAKKFDSMIRGTQDILVKNGIDPQSTIDAWNKTYKSYVPLFREDDDFASHPSQGTGKGFATTGASSKRAMGSTKGVQDIMANILGQRERALIKAEKVRVGRALMGLAVKNPNPKFWLPVNPDAIKDFDVLAADLDAIGLDGADIAGMMEEVKKPEIVTDKQTGLQTVRYKVNPLERYKDHVFPVRVNGKDWYIFFNQNDPRAKRMVEAMKNLDTEQLGAVLGFFGKLTRWFSAVNTQYNPVFGGINLLRDVQGAAINLSSTKIAGEQAKVLAGVMPAMRTIFKTLRAEKDGKPTPQTEMAKLWEEFKEAGGQTLYRDSLTRKAEEKQLIDHELERMKRGPLRKLMSGTAQLLSDFNDTIENAVRLSAYKVAIEKGLSKEQAASIAKNLTVNFDRKGQLGSRINALYAFFNASVQGSARLYETMKGPAGRKIFAGGVALGTIQSIALAAAGFDEDEPPEFVKERNLIIPLGGKNYAMIPMPLGLHFFPNIGRVITEWAINDFKKPGEHITNLFGTAMDAFNPLGSTGLSMQTLAPSVADPFLALEANKDAFGRPIYKKDQATNPTPGYLRSREGATEISKLLAEFINYASGGTKYQKGTLFGPFSSPTGDEIDYLAGQFTGGLGREVMKVQSAVKSQITGEELPPYKVPIAGRFFGDADSKAADSQRFYANVTMMANFENEIKGRQKNGENVSQFMQENPQARLWMLANNAENQISQLNKQRKTLIEKNAPKERIQQIENQKQIIMRRFNDKVKSLEK